jgi:hypothetical protein
MYISLSLSPVIPQPAFHLTFQFREGQHYYHHPKGILYENPKAISVFE